MTIRPHLTRMQGPSFNSYLVEEGLDWVVAARREAGVSGRPATERFTRYAKVAVRNGFGSGAHLTRLPAEFVPTGMQASVPDVEWDSYWATFAFHTARD